jgi:hypothetical protein
MDQEQNAGHHVITKDAVHELFTSGRADQHGRIDGLTEDEFYQKLDDDQAFMDRWYGPTGVPAWASGDNQREHAMADPSLTGEQNLQRDRAWVQDNLAQAHDAGPASNENAMSHLGAAAHALEDSYSEAHEWRDDSEHSGNPDAKVESINVFDPTGIQGGGGVFGVEGTHDERFDRVPIDALGHPILGDDRAAVSATAQMLENYVDEEHASHADAVKSFDNTIGQFFQEGDHGVTVNEHPNDAWEAEDARRWAIDAQQATADPDPGELPSPSPTDYPTSTPSPTHSPTPTVTPTQTPTQTPTPTTPTPTPS